MITTLDMEGKSVSPSLPTRQDQPARPSKTGQGQPAQAPKIDLPNYGIGLRVDDKTHEVVAVIVDRDTNKVIREVPPEEMRVASDVIRNLLRSGVHTVA